MGFLDILKRKNKEGFGVNRSLDIPPAPPMAEKSKSAQEIEEEQEDPLMEDIQEQESSAEEIKSRPIFLSLEKFRNIVEETKIMRNILKENEDILARVSEFKQEEEKEFNRWENSLKNLQKNLVYIDATLFKTER